MREKAKTGWFWLGLCLWGLWIGGFSQAADGSPAGAQPLTVAAAADLQFTFTELGARFEQETGKRVVFTFGSTGNLARQIENGAPVDLFAAANIQFVENLMSKGMLIPGTQQVYAIGRIILASNRQMGLRLHHLRDLLRPEVKRVALANPQHAPYGMAARQALEALGIWDLLKPKLVYGENVRQALQYVQTGNVEAGIVALSIAKVPEVTYTLIDDRLHQPLKQALAVVKGTRDEAMARRFVAFVNGPKGRPVMKRYGFLLPEER